MDRELPDLIGEAPVFVAMLDHVSRVAPLERPVLVVGERGTGKELIAARLHFLSLRWDKPLITLNCAALSDDLLESELFGHEAGAFTGAAKRHLGRFERADGGTLFLDEIAAASIRVQEKLLRVIEYREFERLGGDRTLHADVRIIGATHADLPAEAEAGRFRYDLLDRLAFDVIHVPPLRDRTGDIALLTQQFAAAMARELEAAAPEIHPSACAKLLSHPWPGNVRELKNAVERSVYRHLTSDHVSEQVKEVILDPFHKLWSSRAASKASAIATEQPATRGPPDGSYDYKAKVERIERELIVDALQRNRHHQRATADYLKLTYDQLRGLIRKFELADNG
ncbi:MAG: phage shock protein operon transcriptional activator [Geminicoccaceae bacterium]